MLTHIHPRPGETTIDFLRPQPGKFLLLNVSAGGTLTSVCLSNRSNGSAAWRRTEEDKRQPLDWSDPGFSLTNRTLILKFDAVNALANNFQAIWEAIPTPAVGPDGRVAVGKLPRDQKDMGDLLAGLQARAGAIEEIEKALALSLDTELFLLRRSLGHSTLLLDGHGLSEYAAQVLEGFSTSQQTYAGLPELRGFGTENPGRGQGLPSKKDALLRYHMQRNRTNPLGAVTTLDFLAYERKPLNISDGLKWNCSFEPRTESVDLLLSLGGRPVFTEVKMAGDKFVSSAVVQLLYYASILANHNQRTRLVREIKGVNREQAWLGVIAQDRKDSGFATDLEAALIFLRHPTTQSILSPFFEGAIVLLMQEQANPVDSAENCVSFRVMNNGEHVIRWRGLIRPLPRFRKTITSTLHRHPAYNSPFFGHIRMREQAAPATRPQLRFLNVGSIR